APSRLRKSPFSAVTNLRKFLILRSAEAVLLGSRTLFPQPARRPKITFNLASGETITAPLAGQDEFTVTILDPLGKRQTYAKSEGTFKIDDPMAAHFDQLGKYTDEAMHNVFAYLNTLK